MFGFMLRTTGNLGTPDFVYYDFIFKGILRATADILAGCFAWFLCRYWKSFIWTRTGQIVGTIIETFCYVFALYICIFMTNQTVSSVIILLLIFAFSFSMSGWSWWEKKIHPLLGAWCFKISLALLFSHFYWVQIVQNIFPDKSWVFHVIMYILLTGITCSVNLYLAENWKKYSGKISYKLKKYIEIPLDQCN